MQTSMAITRERQIRGFVIAWLGITLLMGALTFIGNTGTGGVEEIVYGALGRRGGLISA